MNEQEFAQILQTIAEKDIPEDMDYLARIHQRISAQQVVAVHRTRRLVRLLLALLMLIFLLMGTIAAYAMYQVIFGDPGLDGAAEQGLVRDIKQSITIDGVTLTVTEAFADSNRIAVWWTLEGYPYPPESNLIGVSFNPSLWHPDGTLFGTGGMGGQMAGPDDEGIIQGLSSIEYTEPVSEDSVLNVLFRFEIQGDDAYLIPDDFDWESFSGSLPEEFAHKMPSVGPFEFQLSLNVGEALVIEPQMRVISNDIELRLESLEIAPSQTNIVLCFELPDGRDWQPHVSLSIDDNEGLLAGFGIHGNLPSPNDVERCFDMSFLLPYTTDAKELIISVDRLQRDIPEMTEQVLQLASERLADEDIQVEFTLNQGRMNYEVISAPKNMSEADIGMAVFDAMREFYDGKWEFIVPLP